MNKKLVSIIGIIAFVFVTFSIIYINVNSMKNDKQNNDKTVEIEKEDTSELLNMLAAISGIESNNILLTNNPVGIKGDLFVPNDSITRGVDYFLEKTNNDKMKDVRIDIADGFISLFVNYKVTSSIDTSIKVKVIPTLNDNNDLILNIDEVKFLDIKIAKWVVNLVLDNFAEDWFPNDSELKVEFNKGNIIVYKENLNGITLNSIDIESEGLRINADINLEAIMSL